MKSKIFNSQEVQAIIAGRKTMFREVCKIQPSFADQKLLFAESSTDIKHKGKYSWANIDEEKLNITNRSNYFKPKFEVDQEIFVKESWRAFTGETLETPLGKMKIYSCPPKKGDIITYKADAKSYATYLSSTTMPQWASRITLKIKSVKVERLQDMSEEDFYKSGVECLHGTEIADTGDYFDDEYYFGELEEESITECDCDGTMELCYKCSCGGFTSGYTLLNTHNNPFNPYIEFWDSTHKKPEEKWEADPWVFVYEFEVINFKK